MNKPVGILQDLQGPKIRIKTFKEGPIHLTPGQTFTLTTNDVDGTDEIVGVSYTEFARDVHPGDFVLLDDGLLTLTVKEINGPNVICEVVHGGRLSSRSGGDVGSAASVRSSFRTPRACMSWRTCPFRGVLEVLTTAKVRRASGPSSTTSGRIPVGCHEVLRVLRSDSSIRALATSLVDGSCGEFRTPRTSVEDRWTTTRAPCPLLLGA